MQDSKIDEIHEDLDIGEEQVTSNECWEPDEVEHKFDRIFPDVYLGEEQVTSNECYDVEDK